MPKIFDSKKSVFFVGGPIGGTQAGDDNAGGCTKDWFDGNLTELTDLMTANGGPIGDAWNGSQTYCNVTQSGGGKAKVDPPGSEFADCEAGMVVNVKFAGVYSDDRYEIVDIIGGSIEIDLPYTSATTCDAKVGGAFNNLQNACDNTDASNYDVTIHTNKDETLSATLDLDTGGGSIASNTHKRIIGFYQTPGDMDYGGAYYRHTNYGWIDIEGNDIIDDLINIAGTDGIELRNLYLHNITASSSYALIRLTYSGSYVETLCVVNCKFDDGHRGIYGDARNLLVQDCIFNDLIANTQVYAKAHGARLMNCEFNVKAGQAAILSDFTQIVSGCTFTGGSKGIIIHRYNCMAVKNTFHGQTTACISIEHDEASLIEFNNIFDPAAIDDYAVHLINGTVLYSDYSCAYCTAASLTLNSGYAWPEKGPNSIEVNPEFENSGGGDFRPRSPAVLRGGKSDVDQHATQMGAVLQEYQFAKRAMQANHGRLHIIR